MDISCINSSVIVLSVISPELLIVSLNTLSSKDLMEKKLISLRESAPLAGGLSILMFHLITFGFNVEHGISPFFYFST